MKINKKTKTVLGYTKEEAKVRKEELLKILNEYNESFYNEQESKYTDEEIAQFQMEYEELENFVGVSEEEKIAVLDEDEIVVNEDGTISRKKTKLDNLHPLVVILGIIFFVLCCGVISLPIGRSFMKGYIKTVFDKAIDGGITNYDDFPKSEYCYSAGGFWFMAVLGCALVPFISFVLSTVTFVVTRVLENKKQKDHFNSKIALVFMILCFVAAVVSTILIFFKFKKDLNIYMEIPGECYGVYMYNGIIPFVSFE